MEMESYRFQRKRVNGAEHYSLGSESGHDSGAHSWRKNSMNSGSGPVILVHIPLHKSDKSHGGVIGVPILPEGAVSDHPLVSLSSKQR
jgi:hypothetical protein